MERGPESSLASGRLVKVHLLSGEARAPRLCMSQFLGQKEQHPGATVISRSKKKALGGVTSENCSQALLSGPDLGPEHLPEMRSIQAESDAYGGWLQDQMSFSPCQGGLGGDSGCGAGSDARRASLQEVSTWVPLKAVYLKNRVR